MGKLATITTLSGGGSAAVQQPEPAAASSGRAPLWRQFAAGQLLELSGSRPGKLSTAARLIAQAQAAGEPVAWVAQRDGASFYPPDFALAGVDLAALVVVRVPREHGAHALVRACELLLRSGAFGFLALDFASTADSAHPQGGALRMPRGELAWQARLSGLARMHEARLVLLTAARREEPSLGPLIGLRVEPSLERKGARVVLTPHVLKCKLGTSASLSPDVRSLPAGAAAGER